jgi:hypothetical protein
VICSDSDGRVVQKRRGAIASDIRTAKTVHRAMAPERKAHGPQSQNWMYVSHRCEGLNIRYHSRASAMPAPRALSPDTRPCRTRSHRRLVLPPTRGLATDAPATSHLHASRDQDAPVEDVVYSVVLFPLSNTESLVLSVVVALWRRRCCRGLAARMPLARMGGR